MQKDWHVELLIEMFPKDVHDAMRARLAENLRAIVMRAEDPDWRRWAERQLIRIGER